MHTQMLTKYSSLECCLIWKFIHSFLQQMPGTVLGTEDVLGEQNRSGLCPHAAYIPVEETGNKLQRNKPIRN